MALEKVKSGKEDGVVDDFPEDKWLVATAEAGHALPVPNAPDFGAVEQVEVADVLYPHLEDVKHQNHVRVH